MRKTLPTMIVTGALLVAAPSTALAHECIIAPRSETGQANSANSGSWFYLSTETIVSELVSALELDPDVVDADVIARFRQALEAEGLATSFSVHLRLTLGENQHTFERVAAYVDESKSSDGRGVDHLDALFETYLNVFISVL